MAVTLPTFADVGINDPRSVGTQPTYPANDAIAEGEATLGKGIEKVGGAVEDYAADQQRKKAKLEQALATTDLFNRLTPLQEQIAHETDPAKLADLRSQYDQILPTSGTGISDPYARQLWEATHAKTIFHAKAEADARNTVLDRNGILAQVQGQVDQAVRTGAAADDPQAFENAKLAVRNSYDYLGKYGAALPTQVLELNKKAQLDLVAGRIDSLIAKGRVDEASSLLEQNRNDLGAVAAGNMEIRLKKAGDAALGAQIFQRSGGAASAPRGGGDASNPGSLAMAAAAVDPAIEAGIAKKIATTSGLQHWAGIDPDTGKPWNPTLRSAFESAGLPVDGPISEEQWKQADPLILKHESMGGQNVPNYRFDSTHTAGGPHQITNTTWKEFGGPELMAAKGGAKAAPTGELEKAYPNDPRLTSGPLSAGGGAPPLEVWGDSLGVGLKGALKAPGTVKGGITPTAILANIEAQPEGHWQGKTVVLPSGSNGDEMHVVEQTIQYLKEHKANVIAVGYGPKFPEKNHTLATIAERQQVPVIAAEDVGASEGVHPSANGYASMAQKIGALASQPGPAQVKPIPTGPQAAQSTGGTQPPGLAAPGVGDIAAMQQIADQQYAQRLERITADPAAINNPVAFDHASKLAEHEYRRKTLVLTGQMKALTEARNDAATGYVREAMQPGGAPVDMLDRMAADKRLDAPTLENLWKLVETHQKHTVAGDLVTYGPKFFEAYGRLTLDDGDSQKLRDPSQIYAMAQPPKDGSTPDLTLQGVQKLTQSMDELKKRDPALAERKKEFMQLIMPMDRAAEEYSLPQRQRRYNMSWDIDQHLAHLKPGQNPNDLFDPTKPDYLGKPYQAQIDANALARKIQGDPAMKTQDGIAAAYRAGKITKDQAAEALTHLGIKFLDAQSAPPALAPPVAVP